jgi:hypothetical protein
MTQFLAFLGAFSNYYFNIFAIFKDGLDVGWLNDLSDQISI